MCGGVKGKNDYFMLSLFEVVMIRNSKEPDH